VFTNLAIVWGPLCSHGAMMWTTPCESFKRWVLTIPRSGSSDGNPPKAEQVGLGGSIGIVDRNHGAHPWDESSSKTSHWTKMNQPSMIIMLSYIPRVTPDHTLAFQLPLKEVTRSILQERFTSQDCGLGNPYLRRGRCGQKKCPLNQHESPVLRTNWGVPFTILKLVNI